VAQAIQQRQRRTNSPLPVAFPGGATGLMLTGVTKPLPHQTRCAGDVYQAHIAQGRKAVLLGIFATPQEAALAHDLAGASSTWRRGSTSSSDGRLVLASMWLIHCQLTPHTLLHLSAPAARAVSHSHVRAPGHHKL
jgi:hypothetical protein